MILDPDRLNEICEDYGTNMNYLKKCIDTLMTYPCVKEGDEEYLYECLGVLSSGRISENRSDFFGIIEESVYRIYGDDAIPYLSDKFLREHNEM